MMITLGLAGIIGGAVALLFMVYRCEERNYISRPQTVILIAATMIFAATLLFSLFTGNTAVILPVVPSFAGPWTITAFFAYKNYRYYMEKDRTFSFSDNRIKTSVS